ncbi:MAG: helix-turn-helix domain-containing protein [Lachnospiraceae bacterium]|nr:helix-turn-helix domain-containing protein [Lachnospiraceae bacterium]
MDRYIIPEYVTKDDIKRVRESLSMTQKEFADFANCSKRTVERWETEDGKITGPIVTLVDMLARNKSMVEAVTVPKDRYKLRLFYMYYNTVCAIIDVDETERKVKVTNYTNSVMNRPFGSNTEPSFEDYEEFLESRCFPKTRDMIKFELKKLDIPFYDPLMIIEKTEGRMADDHFWIKVDK